MKKYFLLVVAVLFSISLSAQVKTGVWKGKDSQNWFTVIVGSKTQDGMTCEIETKKMKARGQFSKNGTILTFKNSDGILHFKQLKSEREFKNTKGYLQFVSVGGTISYKMERGNLSLPGWEKGQASVVINHEER